MKKTKKAFEWNKVTPLSKYLAMALFIALPVIAFVWGMKYQNAIQPKSITPISGNIDTETTISFNINATSTLPTSNWKTYTSNRYKLTFKYPKDLYVSENDGIYIETPKLDSSLLVIYQINLKEMTLPNYIDKYWNPRKVSLRPFTVGQFQGLYVDDLRDLTRGRNIFFIDSSNNAYRMFYYVRQDIQTKFQPIINTIISTIK